MPIDQPFRQRYEGYFNERRSQAPKFSTASRNTLLTPYHFGGGFGTEPKAPHNVTATPVGPRSYTPTTRHTPSATFGTARRTDVFGSNISGVAERSASPAASSRRPQTGAVGYRQQSFRHQSPQRGHEDSLRFPGPQSYKTKRSDFEIARPIAKDLHALNAKFAHDGTHTPRHYIPGSKGGAIPRSPRLTTTPLNTPGPAAYHPRYGLV
ncbi:Hypothetical protein, putative [Bodo saltans]|uniref:Uncharacterized protein n=1 Tax=Bodo saltans TaxID=75058 RepID=A0A0S4IZE7_BODSA|nr:Hypothetical protein, putative [Bodo saltans]|eukprot:CUG07549.1 Hypothetical protein, putative [Bodo saltans]